MFSFFKKKPILKETIGGLLVTDMHSHLLPGIDDGAGTIQDSITMIEGLMLSGYRKFIATPHIMNDFYPNTPEIIFEKLDELKKELKDRDINVEIEAAAEYYLDEWLMEKLNSDEKLLSFGNNYILFETSFMNPSPFLHQAVFLMQTKGYRPIFAHPERYFYFYDDFAGLENLFNKNIDFQINLNSLTGYYGKPAKDMAEKLIDKNMVTFAGTDCHAEKHLLSLQKVTSSNYFKKLASLPLKNKLL